MSDEIIIAGMPVNVPQLVREIKQDIRDDWYPDSLGYEDSLKTDLISEAFVNAFELNDGLFKPGPRMELNIPKKGFVLRYSLETSLLDRAYYHALVRLLAPFYDPLLSNHVLSHRYADTGNRTGRYFFHHPIEQWKLFEGYVAEEARNKPVVLITDVQNYFENIAIDKLAAILRGRIATLKASGGDKARIHEVITHLERCLKNWCYAESHGLPQNRDASSFLANLVMLPIDEQMIALGHSYFRYMDDIRIATSSKYAARAALQDLIVELRKIGLNVNASKTDILEPSDPKYHTKLQSREGELEQIDNMWRSRSLAVIRRSFEPLSQLALRLITEKRTQDRAFRFCVKRFENLALCEEIETPDDFFTPLVDAVIDELDNQPSSSDQIVRFLKAAPLSTAQIEKVADFLRDRERAIYDWQNYLLWQVLVYKAHANDAILSLAQSRSRERHRQADRAGAMLYLGAMGTDHDRAGIASSFDEYQHHLLQRNALIAVHELEYNSSIKDHVAPHVLPSLKGTYKRIRESFKGCYHRALPPISYLDIYDDMTSYE